MLTSRSERRLVGDVDAVEQDPALGRQLEAGDHPEGRRLARAGRAEHREELAVADVEVDAVDGDEPIPAALRDAAGDAPAGLAGAEDLRQALEPDGGHGVAGRAAGVASRVAVGAGAPSGSSVWVRMANAGSRATAPSRRGAMPHCAVALPRVSSRAAAVARERVRSTRAGRP